MTPWSDRQSRHLFFEEHMSLRDILEKQHGPTALIPRLNEFVVSDKYRSLDVREGGWHPSDFCGMCERQKVISKLVAHKANDIPFRLQKIFDTGSALHKWYQEMYFGPMGILWGKWKCRKCRKIHWGLMPNSCDECGAIWWEDGDHMMQFKEVPFFARLPGCEEPVLGHCDGLIKIGAKWYLLEIKSMTDKQFPWLKAPLPKHKQQGQIYAELAKQGLIRGLPSGVEAPMPEAIKFLYICKNDSENKEFTEEMDSEFAREELRRPIGVERALRDQVLPARLEECPMKSKGRARKCSRRDYCFGKYTFEDLEMIGAA